MLSPSDFAGFFQEVHGHKPFPWQRRLLEQLVQTGRWPSLLNLPTGSGKTATIDIAVFHLALEAPSRTTRRAPVRIAFVVDRRLIVDDAFARAQRLEQALDNPTGPVTAHVAENLRSLSNFRTPLIARRVRGGIPREDDWARTPSQPTVLCSTVDQIGSRLLFRGYGVSDSMKPVHAGLIGSDCLMLLDEAHLAEPFRQTLEWIQLYGSKQWRSSSDAGPWALALLTATPGERHPPDAFTLEEADKSHPVLKRRLSASKPARLMVSTASRVPSKGDKGRSSNGEAGGADEDLLWRARAFVEQVEQALAYFESSEIGTSAPAIGVVVNRIARARAVYELLKSASEKRDMDLLLLIGPARSVDRDDVSERLAAIRTDTPRNLDRPLVLIATQCIEAGVDIDLDSLITEVAPLDALRQRFGRLNRAGRSFRPYASILATKYELSERNIDPIYGKSLKHAWEQLKQATRADDDRVEFGLDDFTVELAGSALSPKSHAPILLPAHLDLLSQTSPIPTSDPDIALYLHGARRQPDSITVVWRADLDLGQDSNEIRELLLLVPPRSLEAIELPLWVIQQWLRGEGNDARLGDAATAMPEDLIRRRPESPTPAVFRWFGDDPRSCWVNPSALRPGNTIVVPASYGGVDQFGWNPASKQAATDVAQRAAKPFLGRRFSLRIAPGLIGEGVSEEILADTLASTNAQRWQGLRSVLFDLDLPKEVRADLEALDQAKKKRVDVYLDLYGTDRDRPRGVVFVAPFGLVGGRDDEDGRPNATEDDISGSLPGFALPLEQHSQDVERKAELFAVLSGLSPERISDLRIAGYLHDAGKVDARFQAWLYHGDPLGPDPAKADEILAKSARPVPRTTQATSSLPNKWRHEAFSVRLAPHSPRFLEAADPDLVLWLVGSHHGHGRPFFPHAETKDVEWQKVPAVLGLPAEVPPEVGPQALSYNWRGLDWPSLFKRLKLRYGLWELARMEAILRLADHRSSEDAAAREAEQ